MTCEEVLVQGVEGRDLGRGGAGRGGAGGTCEYERRRVREEYEG